MTLCRLLAIERSRRGRDATRRYACTCGQRGSWRATAALALAEFRSHAGIVVHRG